VKARASKKLNFLKTLAHKEWGDQNTLLRIRQMVVLSMLRYGETIYGSASKAALKTIDPEHQKGVKIAQGVFVVCKTDNALCEAGLPTLAEMREFSGSSSGSENSHKQRKPH
jgi:hypothetical protein